MEIGDRQIVVISPFSVDTPAIEVVQKPVGWALRGVTNRSQWIAAGQRIATLNDNIQWEWGRWWLFGEEHNFGDLKSLTSSKEWKEIGGPPYRTMSNILCVCRAFTPERVRASFSHHALLTSLSYDAQEDYLDWRERTQASVDGLRREIEHRQLSDESAPVKKGKGRERLPLIQKVRERIDKNQKADMDEIGILLISKTGLTDEQRQQTAKTLKRAGNAYLTTAEDLWCHDDEMRFQRRESAKSG